MRISKYLLPGLIILVSISGAFAQSTIINVPSTDVMAEKKLYVEADFIAHFDKYENGGFQTYGYRMVYGFSRKFEAGVNFFYTRNGFTSAKELQVNAKYQAYSNEKHGVAAAIGGWLFQPLNRSSGRRTTGMVYATGSKQVRRLKGIRMTGGGYQVVNAERGSGNKRGFIVGVEQPIVGKLNFAGDWFTGKNRFGFASAGLSYTIARRHFIQAGYSWGNSGRGNNGFFVFYGITF